MLLVSGKLANEKVTVDDSSPEGTVRIRVVFDKGKLISQEPASKKLSIMADSLSRTQRQAPRHNRAGIGGTQKAATGGGAIGLKSVCILL
jgi:hypothetical protein